MDSKVTGRWNRGNNEERVDRGGKKPMLALNTIETKTCKTNGRLESDKIWSVTVVSGCRPKRCTSTISNDGELCPFSFHCITPPPPYFRKIFVHFDNNIRVIQQRCQFSFFFWVCNVLQAEHITNNT